MHEALSQICRVYTIEVLEFPEAAVYAVEKKVLENGSVIGCENKNKTFVDTVADSFRVAIFNHAGSPTYI
jgi:hypothetical protein